MIRPYSSFTIRTAPVKRDPDFAKQNKQLQSQILALQAELQILCADLDDLKATRKPTKPIRDISGTILQNKRKIDEISARIAVKEREFGKISAASAERRELQDAISKAKAEHSLIKARKREVLEQIASAKTRIEIAGDGSAWAKQKPVIQSEIADAQQRIADIHREIAAIQQRVAETEQHRDLIDAVCLRWRGRRVKQESGGDLQQLLYDLANRQDSDTPEARAKLEGLIADNERLRQVIAAEQRLVMKGMRTVQHDSVDSRRKTQITQSRRSSGRPTDYAHKY